MRSPDPLATGRSFVAWAIAHGLPRQLVRGGARKGDLISRITIDPAVAADPYPAYDLLREQGRVVHNGMLAASADHAACNEILRSEDFGTGSGHAELPSPVRRLLARATDPRAAGPVDPPSMLVVDPPDHTRYRKLVSRAFTARKVARMGDRVESVATRLLDDLAGEDGFDVVERYAGLLPVAVIADLLGVPEAEHGELLALGNQAAATLDPALTFRQYREVEHALRGMHDWFDGHLERLRRDPGDGLLSGLLQDPAADRLTWDELHAVGLLVLGAGFETTVNLIGNAVALLDAHPDQLARLQQDPGGWPNAVEEVLRVASPVQFTMRSALRDVEVAGVAVGGGDAVLVVLGGANRDPAVFADPHRFDVTRANAGENLAFSAGIHFCLGASLARLEAATGLRLLYERFPDLRVVGPAERRRTRVLRGYERLPVAVRKPAAATR